MKVGDLVTPAVKFGFELGIGVIVGIDEEGRFEVLWNEKVGAGIYHHPGFEIKVVA
jgi:hypothetical protein